MSVITMSVLGALLVALSIAFFYSIFSTEKIDLAGRIEKSRVEEMVREASKEQQSHISNSRYGEIYRKTFEKQLGDSGIRKVAHLLGVDIQNLQEQITRAGMDGKISAEELVSLKMLGIVGVVLFGGVGAIYQDVFFFGMGFTIFAAAYILPMNKIKSRLKQMDQQILAELPGFIERTYMCMESGANLKQALEIVSETAQGLLGDEFQRAFIMADYTTWEKEVERMAESLRMEALQDFIADILSAYEKGVSVIDTLKDEAVHMNRIRRSNAMSEIGALETKVMLLIMIFSLLPTMGILILPVMINSMALL